jgi:hypothetical protein
VTYPNQPNPYGQPANGPQHAQPQYSQPQYGQQHYRHGAPYGHAGYQPGYPGYSAVDPDPPSRSNPAAGILLLIGVLAGLGACFLPYDVGTVAAYGGVNDLPLISAITHLPDTFEAADVTSHGWRYIMWSLAIIALAVGVLICLIAGLLMFAGARRRHTGAACTALIGALIMLGTPIMMIIATDGAVFDYLDVSTILALGAWIPAMVGAFVGFSR